MEPYKFISSNASIRRALKYEDTKDIVSNNGVWEWVSPIDTLFLLYLDTTICI